LIKVDKTPLKGNLIIKTIEIIKNKVEEEESS